MHRRVNRCISALNSLYFGGDGKDVKVPSGGLSSLPLVQRDAINLITRRVVEAGTPPLDACGPEALRALRVASSAYHEDPTAGVGDTVSMKLSALSLPSMAGKGVQMSERLFLQGFPSSLAQ